MAKGPQRPSKGLLIRLEGFDGKDITRFLKVYICEMEVY